MAEIITTLHPDNDSNTNLYPNIKRENIPNRAITTNKLDDDVLSLIGSLKPSGTDTSTNILAYTSNKGIYVATDNGHWYYWNGNAYADGGVYQAREIAFGSINIENLSKDISNNFTSINLFNRDSIVSGGYYDADGSVYDNANSQYSTQFIPVKYGVTYKFNFGIDTSFQILTYESNGGFIERINNKNVITYTFNQNVAFIRLSVYNNSFINDFMFCEIDKYPLSYKKYELKVINDVDVLGEMCEINKQTTLTLSNIPLYSTYDNNCYVDIIGGKETSDQYNSISIYAYESFDIWVTSLQNGYFSLAVFRGGVWSSSNFLGRYRTLDNNLPDVNNKLTIYKGQLLVITYSKTYPSFVCDVDNLINSFVFKNQYVLNETQIKSVTDKISVVKNGNDYNIKMGKYSFPFNKVTNLTTNLDSYDINNIYVNGQLLESGNILGTVRETNQDDFMGGVIHGNEELISMNIYCDGKPITDNVLGDKIDIFLISNLKRVSDHTTNVVERNVHIIFENNKMIIKTNYKILVDNFNTEVVYVGMWGQYDNQINKLFTNEMEYNISEPQKYSSNKIYNVSYISNYGIVDISILKGFDYPKYICKLVHYDDTLRVKNYFTLVSNEIFNTNDLLYGVTEYKFN